MRTKRSERTSNFPIRDRYTVSGHVVGEVCFECRCRVLEFAGDERIVFAWCECDFPDDAAEMEILSEVPDPRPRFLMTRDPG